MPGKSPRRIRVLTQRLIQGLSLACFLWLLGRATLSLYGGEAGGPPPDFFLRLDPLLAVAVPLAAREWIAALWPGLLVLLLAPLLGRVFCGYICPMGSTLDLGRFVFFRKKKRGEFPAPGNIRFVLLAAVLAAAALGVNLAFWAAPLPLVTRFYALLLQPVALLGGNEALTLTRPLVAALDVPGLDYLVFTPRRYDTLLAVAAFFGVLFWLEGRRPRFWCRFLCPAGAALGLLSLLPLWRRRVTACSGCGSCVRACPMGAIAPGGKPTSHSDCIACRTCADVCPEHGVSFAFSGPSPHSAAIPSRRVFLAGALGGAGLAALQYSSAHSLLLPGQRGVLWPSGCIRPPAAVPEPDFLARCVRCGLCMKACPSNGLQPSWFSAGPEGMFSPVLVPRRGPCEPDCNLCGKVCPTGALRPLSVERKKWAKVGTAVVHPGRCLAWAEGKRCVVCQEVCPYGAVKLEQRSGADVPVPVVRAERCFGCGYCEHHCPVRLPAIAVEPLNALRLNSDDYESTAREAGLILSTTLAPEMPETPVSEDSSLPPGFTD